MTALTGVEFFEGEETHAAYQARREAGLAPNELIEEYVFDQVLGSVRDLDVLDLGCGDGRYGRSLIDRGCRSYLGIDASSRMIELAGRNLAGTDARFQRARIDGFSFPVSAFDFVVSRMTLHWLAELPATFERVRQALRPGGRLVFSVEHPVLTCSDAARIEGQGRTHWIVDDYFIGGARTRRWFGATVKKDHRTVEEYFQLLRATGFCVDDMREGVPSAERISDPAELRRRQRVPLVLVLSARGALELGAIRGATPLQNTATATDCDPFSAWPVPAAVSAPVVAFTA
jgi:SAM-dependent methyltransferase